ncbi:EscU/YscU/HrcU family type III secretion system export apparatus switch protein [Gemmobacter serpentinus]|uniref:EscU/YscU/HrcU family type III secretion system export apparatus switch protein n=1 Tax=Gemmobacter serpentinus TaxID=2652247 RepID=UPI00124F0753|nr:flagellar type III secretion system protein FlhB [Gemmobacter serpentinus]
MSAGGEGAADRPHEASQKRLEDMRKEGRIARSPDLLAAGAYAGFVLAATTLGGWSLHRIGAALVPALDRPEALAPLLLGSSRAIVPGFLLPLAQALLPLLVLPALFVCLLLVLQRAWLVTPANLLPRLSRVSPSTIAAQKFGLNGLFEFFKSSMKLGLTALILGAFLVQRLDPMLGSLWLEPRAAMGILLILLRDFLIVVAAMAGAFGGVDYLWQALRHRQQARMSRQEVTEEHREAEGDPQARAHRRARGQEIAMNRMLRDVPNADVVIVNPTHYAVALAWDRGSGRAPICIAKGMDEIAARIRERALAAGVPIQSDPPTARALYATLEIGDEVGRKHYKAVAAAIRFAEMMRRKAGRRG